MKKYWVNQEKICFLGYVVSFKKINRESEQIEVIRKWPELKLVRDIQVFLSFANFYQQFIQDFSKIAVSLILILKITTSSDLSEPEVRNGNSKVFGFSDGSSNEELAKK